MLECFVRECHQIINEDDDSIVRAHPDKPASNQIRKPATSLGVRSLPVAKAKKEGDVIVSGRLGFFFCAEVPQHGNTSD
jgi:hypothetical protein